MKKIKILDAFAGVGGFHLAFKNVIWEENLKCVWFSEIDRWAEQTYLKNFPWTNILWDISKINIDNLPNFDVLTGWFPCQDVSVAWKRDLVWWRTILVEYLLRILEQKQPNCFIFENVRGLLSNKFKEFFESIIKRAEDAWYNVSYKLMDTKKHWWLAQSRPRVYIVWIKKTINKEYVFPNEIEIEKKLWDVVKNWVDIKYYYPDKKLKKLIDFWATNSFWGRIQTKDYHWAILASYWIWAWNWWAVVDEFWIRILTENEAEYLQGFPTNWTEWVSMRNRYKQIGNAITVKLAERIIYNLVEICKHI